MAILVYDQPDPYSLAHNDNPFVFKSTNYTDTQRFKIVILPDDYPVSPALSTHRVYPRQGVDSNGVVTNDRTYFDPSRVLQSLLKSEIAIPSANHTLFEKLYTTHYEYSLFIQEEDISGGVYVGGETWVSNIKSVWNGVRYTSEWNGFDYTDYTTGGSSRAFLTDAPTTQYINSNQSLFLYVLALDADDTTEVTIKSYDNSGLLATARINNTYSSGIASNYDARYLRLAVGTYDIANVDPTYSTLAGVNTMLNGATYYTVQLTKTGSAKSELITIYIDQKCTKYTPVRLHWLNTLGGFDAYNFNYKSEVKTEIERSSYVQQHHNFTGTRWQYDKMSRGRTEYDVKYMVKQTINTDFLTDEESIWMESLLTSPVIYLERYNELVAVNINDKSIQRMTSLNDKLCQYTFEIEESLTNNRQRG